LLEFCPPKIFFDHDIGQLCLLLIDFGPLPVSNKVIFDKVIFDKVIFDEVIFDEVIFDEVIFDEVIFDEVIFDEMSDSRFCMYARNDL
jgi:hypothetical protein